MHYICEQCDNTSSGNKRSCRQCKSKKWLLVDDEGMVHVQLEFNTQEMNLIKKAAKEKYDLQRVSRKHMQRFLEELMENLANDIKTGRFAEIIRDAN